MKGKMRHFILCNENTVYITQYKNNTILILEGKVITI